MSRPQLTPDQLAWAVAMRDELQFLVDRSNDVMESAGALRMIAPDVGAAALVPELAEAASAACAAFLVLVAARQKAEAFIRDAEIVGPMKAAA
jgi:hypothetical protein